MEAIESVIAQKCKDWELIIVDDGSTDDTAKAVRKYLVFENIKYLKLEKNSGVCSARNYAISHARGEWIFLLDSDCVLNKNSIETLKKVIDRYPKSSFHKFMVKTFRGVLMGDEITSSLKVGFKEYFRNRFAGEYTPLIKKSMMEKHPFIEDINGGEGIVWKSIVQDVGHMYYHPNCIINYDDEGNDRLSLRYRNYGRLYPIFSADLRTHFLNYIRYAQIQLVLVLLKFIGYNFMYNLKRLFLH